MSDDSQTPTPTPNAPATSAPVATAPINVSSGAPIVATPTPAIPNESPSVAPPVTASVNPVTAPLTSAQIPLEGTTKHRSLIQDLDKYIKQGGKDIEVGAADILAWLKKHL